MGRTRVIIRWPVDHWRTSLLTTRHHPHPLEYTPSGGNGATRNRKDDGASGGGNTSSLPALCSVCHHGQQQWLCVVANCTFGICDHNRSCREPSMTQYPMLGTNSDDNIYMRLHPQHPLVSLGTPLRKEIICIQCERSGYQSPASYRCSECPDVR
jgi:hypothetical protein